MGGSPSKRGETPLEWILKNWNFFKIDGLKKKTYRVFYILTLPGLYANWGMGENGLKMGLLSYHWIFIATGWKTRLRLPMLRAFWPFLRLSLYVAPIIKCLRSQKLS